MTMERKIMVGLKEAVVDLEDIPLTRISPTPNWIQTQSIEVLQSHCINLVAASNPYPLPTPVYCPHIRVRCNHEVIYLMPKLGT
ncbi:hypothetical protein M8C21_008741 [Ambrosia artemisiifolia]|uniref:Uncharacterized protein n=1 Tax=Ambrosia artemisiifolia TaxID=4212 RepID=A0AAD5GYT5_AMBAR|nr:hypothetical protein M8C21_008741 [Ambrosia artemisiifolia]